MKFPWQKNNRQQNLLVLTEDQRIAVERLPVEKGCVVGHDTQEAWVLSFDSLAPKRGTDITYLVVGERETAPICLNGNGKEKQKSTTKLVEAIAAESREEAHFNLKKKEKKDKAADILQILILGFALVTVVVIIAALLTTGDLKLPDF